MKKLTLIVLASCFVMFANCQTKTKTKKTAKDQPQSTTTSTGEVKVTYRVVVSFTSHSSGIDSQKYDAIEAYIKNHAKKPAFDVIAKGREGEREICLHLKELTKSEQIAFIDELKKLAQGSDRVFVNENAERVKKQ